jgi:hypothetical protein
MGNCNCTYSPCENKGHCCQCIAYHRKSNELPACFFDSKTEKTYDRSVENYMRMNTNKR